MPLGHYEPTLVVVSILVAIYASYTALTLAERVPGNDLLVLVALAEGMRLGDADPDPARPPQQPVLFATGSDDPILEPSRRLASATPAGEFVEIPLRHHFNAPGSRAFREAAVAFLGRT